eukprot:746914-Hanusia_phi.AAC.2
MASRSFFLNKISPSSYMDANCVEGREVRKDAECGGETGATGKKQKQGEATGRREAEWRRNLQEGEDPETRVGQEDDQKNASYCCADANPKGLEETPARKVSANTVTDCCPR